jgi:hypothetical protein
MSIPMGTPWISQKIFRYLVRMRKHGGSDDVLSSGNGKNMNLRMHGGLLASSTNIFCKTIDFSEEGTS